MFLAIGVPTGQGPAVSNQEFVPSCVVVVAGRWAVLLNRVPDAADGPLRLPSWLWRRLVDQSLNHPQRCPRNLHVARFVTDHPPIRLAVRVDRGGSKHLPSDASDVEAKAESTAGIIRYRPSRPKVQMSSTTPRFDLDGFG